MITSSLGFEECTHKLLKINLREGQEVGSLDRKAMAHRVDRGVQHDRGDLQSRYLDEPVLSQRRTAALHAR